VCVRVGGGVVGIDGVSNGGLFCHSSCDVFCHKSGSVIHELLWSRGDNKPTKTGKFPLDV